MITVLLITIISQDLNLGKQQISPTQIPANAVTLANANLGTIPELDRSFQRYIWIPQPTKTNMAAVSYVVNISPSRASVIINPEIIADGALLRWDLRQLAPSDKDLAELIKIWEKLSFEPYFHIIKPSTEALPIDAVIVASLDDDPLGSIRFEVDGQNWYRSPSKKFFKIENNQWTEITTVPWKNTDVPVYGAHTGLDQATLLQGLTNSSAAIVRYDYFITKALTVLDGGLYYEFSSIERNPTGKTSQEAFLETLGASEKLVEELQADQRAAIFRSLVTGKPRRIDAFYGVSKPETGGLITITRDLADEDVEAEKDPIRNLLQFKDAAREIIGVKRNGLHVFALFDGNGGLQDSAPDNVVKDHTIPPPYTSRLQPAISCIRCHGPHEGMQPFENEVQKLLSGYLDVFDDLSSKDSIPEILDRLAGLYAGDFTIVLSRTIDDYDKAVYKATGGMGVKDISAITSTIFANYNYKMVDAYTACLELGYKVPQGSAVEYLQQLVPPLDKDVLGISPEDPIIGALKAGLKVNRYQFEQVYADMAFRTLQTHKQQIEFKLKSKNQLNISKNKDNIIMNLK